MWQTHVANSRAIQYQEIAEPFDSFQPNSSDEPAIGDQGLIACKNAMKINTNLASRRHSLHIHWVKTFKLAATRSPFFSHRTNIQDFIFD